MQDLSELHGMVDGQGQTISDLQFAVQTQEQTISQIGQEMAGIKQDIQALQNSIIKLQSALTYPKRLK